MKMSSTSFAKVHDKQVVSKIVELIAENRLTPKGDAFETKGREFLTTTVSRLVDSKRPITMVLPAFPMKSPNIVKKTLGILPDRGEEIALRKLESISRNIDEFYEFGARVVIFRDGNVFNDLLGVSDETMVYYGEELRLMANEYQLTHIDWDDMENHLAKKKKDLDLTSRLKAVREELLSAYLPDGFDIEKEIETKESLCDTYRGFIRFLCTDLEGQMQDKSGTARKKAFGVIAKEMLKRNEAFSRLVSFLYPDAVRLSIHAHKNDGPKFGFNLFTPAQAIHPATPWHNVIVEHADGTYEVVQKADVDIQKFRLVHKHGRPWCYKQCGDS